MLNKVFNAIRIKSNSNSKFSSNLFRIIANGNNSKNFTWKIDYSYDTRDFLTKTNDYESKLNDISSNNIDIDTDTNTDNTPIPGKATPTGTTTYTTRNNTTTTTNVHSSHFKTLSHLNCKISTLGIGTYMGAPDDINDFYMYNAVKSSVLSNGFNHIDTAINYRYMKSERAVGKAISTLVNKYNYKRDELIVSSKIGYVPEDADNGHRCHSFIQKLIESNSEDNSNISLEDVIFDDKKRPVHCIHPAYLRQQLDLSLQNLNLETVDIMYLHNVFESQGAILPEREFEERLGKAFEFMVSKLYYIIFVFIFVLTSFIFIYK